MELDSESESSENWYNRHMLGLKDSPAGESLDALLRRFRLIVKPTSRQVMSSVCPKICAAVGLGLFAARSFAAGELICPIFGKWVAKQGLNNDGEYTIEHRGRERRFWTFKMHVASPATFANAEQVNGFELYKPSNAKVTTDWRDYLDWRHENQLETTYHVLEALVPIAEGEEIVWSYGEQFRLNENLSVRFSRSRLNSKFNSNFNELMT